MSLTIEELEQSGRDHDAKEADHSRKFLNLERTTAELIRMLLLCSQRKFVLEIGLPIATVRFT